MNSYLLNAFSLQMVDAPCSIKIEQVNEKDFEQIKNELTSAVGHADTATVLGVPCNRINIKLEKGDTAYVAQLQGGRLPEGSTTLPEGFKFVYLRVAII